MVHDEKHTHANRSLSRKAALAQTTIIAVVVLIFSLAIVSFNTYRLHSQLESRIENIAHLAETSLTSAVWQVDHASARDFIEAVLQDESVAFAQLITGREVLASRSRAQFAGKPYAYFENNKRFLTQTVEIKKFGDWIGTFNLAVSTSPIQNEMLVNAATTLALALILILTISQTTLYFSRRRIFLPLKRLEESATAIADGDLDADVDISLPGELGSLARAFDDMRESVRHLISDLQSVNFKLENHRKDLEETVKLRTDELKRKNDSLNHALDDVRQAQKSAELANLAKSRFLASMSHEIRTPMNAILGMADILWETQLSSDQSRYVQVFKTAGESLLDILNDILDLSKIEAGHLELEETGFSLTEIIDKTCTFIEPKTQEKQLDFTCQVAANVPDWIEGDPTRLRQILLNLLGNAVKFTGNGAIHLFVERAPGHDGARTIQFSVADTGLGIATNKLSTIFDSFTQADSSTTREFGGTGLGLTISKQLVQLMGGKIWAESSPGSGSTFHFTAQFQIPSKKDVLPVKSEIQNVERVELSRSNILLMEDSKYNAFVIQTYLKDTPCRLTVAKNGSEGFELFKKSNFDLVLMDIQMPSMDGYETTQAIRKWEISCDQPRTPVIAMTAYALVGDAEKCLDAGADSYLPKPVKKSSLFSLIRTLLDPDRPIAAAPSKATPHMETLSNVKKSIIAAGPALEREDYASVKALGADIAQQGLDMTMSELTGYGDALKNAADNEPDPARIRQVLDVLSEYVERLASV